MAAAAQKRQRPNKQDTKTLRKRQKTGQNAAQQRSSAAKQALATKVRLENLSWNAIDMPDKLDDYEGFFGLEEIDDVEVVKDAATGRISFATHSAVTNGLTESASNVEDVDEGLSPAEFEGFSDEEGEKSGSQAPSSILKVEKPTKTKPEKDQAKPKKETVSKKIKKEPAPKPTVTGKSAFEVIHDEADGTIDHDMTAWRDLKLAPDTLAGLSKLKFTKPTSIQAAVIPEIRSGSDLIGKASTGSGKTLAFGIPVFEAYLDRRHERTVVKGKDAAAPLALIVSPTRELAHQISQHLQDLSNGLPDEKPMIATLTGGLSVQKQQRQLKNADIVIGTPGRLWEIISGGQDLIKRMRQVQYLVLDEADRLLSQGHFKELEELLTALDRKTETIDDGENDTTEHAPEAEHPRQTLVFSATFQRDLQHKLARKQRFADTKSESMEYLLHRLNFRMKPKYIDVDPIRQMAANLKEGIVECAGQEKDLYLYALHLLHPTSRTLVFVNSISSVRRLVPLLQNLGLPALALHSQMAQKARLRSVERFTASKSKSSILVATDVAARGLDIPNIDLVLHYHLPRASDMYIHRSGRTARAGASGTSILLCSPDEVAGTRRLVARVHASAAASSDLTRAEAASKGFMIRSLDIDRRIVARLKPRAELAKRIADVEGAKEKKRGRDDLFRQAAEDLGVDYDSEEMEREAPGWNGRGSGRRQKERDDRAVGKDEVRGMRAQLKAMLAQRVNVGVSERYPTSGTIDIDALLREEEGEFLGQVAELDMD